MKTILFAALLVFGLVLMAQPADAENEAIKQVIQTAYVVGLQNEGDTLKIDSGIPGLICWEWVSMAICGRFLLHNGKTTFKKTPER